MGRQEASLSGNLLNWSTEGLFRSFDNDQRQKNVYCPISTEEQESNSGKTFQFRKTTTILKTKKIIGNLFFLNTLQKGYRISPEIIMKKYPNTIYEDAEQTKLKS